MNEKVLANKDLFFNHPFAERIKEGWDKFSGGEEKLRTMIINKEEPNRPTRKLPKHRLTCPFAVMLCPFYLKYIQYSCGK